MSTNDMLKMLSMFKGSNHNVPAIVNKLEEWGLHVLAKKRFGLEHIAKIENIGNKAENPSEGMVRKVEIEKKTENPEEEIQDRT